MDGKIHQISWLKDVGWLEEKANDVFLVGWLLDDDGIKWFRKRRNKIFWKYGKPEVGSNLNMEILPW